MGQLALLVEFNAEITAVIKAQHDAVREGDYSGVGLAKIKLADAVLKAAGVLP